MEADYIPFEIQAEIMKRLTAKSLIRFRSVSKPWNSLIRSSKFIRDSHTIRLDQPHRLILIRYSSQGGNDHAEKFVSIVDDDTFPEQKVSIIIPISAKDINNPMVVCCCHGLFCFYDMFSNPNKSQTKRAILWNPTIRKSVDIPVSDLDTSIVNCKIVIGFGFCPRTSNIKFVKIRSPIGFGWDTFSHRVEVFTLKSGIWRNPHSNVLPSESIVFEHKQVVVDEGIYWLALKKIYVDGEHFYQYQYLIISFDMMSENFVELHLPESVERSERCLSISKLKESLVVVATSWSSLLVWIMQNGDPKSLTPIFTIDTPHTSIGHVLGFTESGKSILLKKTNSKEDELLVYEPNLQQIKSIGSFGALDSFSVHSYTETLLLLDH